MTNDDRTPTGGQPPALVTTGIRTLDKVIGGGIQRGSIVLLIGAPGSGKTMLAQQHDRATLRARDSASSS